MRVGLDVWAGIRVKVDEGRMVALGVGVDIFTGFVVLVAGGARVGRLAKMSVPLNTKRPKTSTIIFFLASGNCRHQFISPAYILALSVHPTICAPGPIPLWFVPGR